MAQDFIMVAGQVAVLFVLMSLGLIGTKTGLIKQAAISSMTNIALYFVTPCVIINSFQRERAPELTKGLLITAAVALAVHIISILLVHLIIRDKDDSKQRVYRFGAVFSNCGFMALPIQYAILGDIGVFFGSVYIAVFNIVLWTYGPIAMSGDKSQFNIRQLIFNPGVLGTLCGLLIFTLQIKLPMVVATPIEYLAALNTPLPMLIIGSYLAEFKLRDLKNVKQYIAIGVRLIVIPLAALALMALLNVPTDIAVVSTIAASAPTAAVTAMFATRFGKDAKLASGMVSTATLFSLITIPILVTLAGMI